ncbi:phosphotransferase [Streptomyces sp. WG7]|uniref:phosphotransferase n=1 Tax=Streptomyces sp. WG7 TaxID=3417650 RepID=UPI003CF11F38
MTNGVYAVPTLARPTVAEVFVHAAALIYQAAGEIWPDERVLLEAHVPSVTGCVHRARVGDRALYVKTSMLGVSLVSLLRGKCGGWPAVREAQREYVKRSDSLLEREAAQLRALAGLDGPRVCAVAGVRGGVIFTEAVTGPTLGDLLLIHPGDTSALVGRCIAELRPLHRPGAARRLGTAGATGERSVDGTFCRKFNGEDAAAYVVQRGTEQWRGESDMVAELVRISVRRLLALRETLPAPAGTSLAYGDLKPEHVLFPDGPDGRPVLLDPGLLRASPMVDVAKLLSRTVLLLAARRPDQATARLVLDGLATVARSHVGRLPLKDRRAWLRHLLVLWLMDTLNIMTTYLSAPAALPLPGLGAALVERAVPMCSLVDAVSADLMDPTGRRGRGDRTLTRILEAIA